VSHRPAPAGIPLRKWRQRGLAIGFSVALVSQVATAVAASDVDDSAEQTRTEINKNVTDPVSLTWSLKIKNDISFLDIEGHGDQPQYSLKFQPTMPTLLTPDLKLIARPEFTLVDDKPYTKDGELLRTTGVGDTILDLVLSPVSDPWLIALGPTFVFPTANLDQTGQGKWQAGPAGVAGYRSKIWLAGVIAQQWWSFAGAADRSAVSELHLQYLASYFFGDGWSIGTDPTIKVDWRASSGNRVTFPIGPVFGKVVKVAGTFPVKVEIDATYAPVHPDTNGEQFDLQLKITPVIPALLPGPLFGGGT
jgi:hypothetical protein